MKGHVMRSIRNWIPLFGVTLAVLALAYACGGSPNTPTTPTTPAPTSGSGSATADVTITIVGMNGSLSFSPNPAIVKVGQSVAWKNADTLTHTATADGGTFNTNSITPGTTSAPITMTAAGSFGYHCSPHPSMVGTLTVQ
jgi:plastocyanin